MAEGRKGFFGRLVEGLAKTRSNIVSGIDSIFSGFSAIDDDFYEEIEETLIMGDLGIQTTMSIVEDLRKKVKEQHIREPEEIERFRQTAGVNCKTILVRRPTLEQARGQLGNRSDDGVAAYAYDAEFLNDGSLEELPAKVHDFLQALIKR